MCVHTISYIQKPCPYFILQAWFHTRHCKKLVLQIHNTKHNNTIDHITILEPKKKLTPMFLHIRPNELFHHEDCGFNTPKLKWKHIEHKHLHISFSNTSNTICFPKVEVYSPKQREWLCAKNYNTCSIGVCARAQRKCYMDTKEIDHLTFCPCISYTKK